jgi:hypothetical protein
LQKSGKRIKHLIVFKDNSLNKILVLPIILLFVITSFSAAQPQNPTTITTTDDQARGIVWDVTVNFNEPGGAYEYTVFGEAPDANDGPPADAYDVLKPPAPMPPYIRAWLNDNLPFPYNKLWKDYRHYPGINKIWNLSVQWTPSDDVSPTTVTMVWDPTEINSTEYISIMLCTTGGTPLKNMLLESSYSFSCPANIPQGFKIICVANQPPNVPSNPTPSNGSTGVSVNADLSWTCSDPDGDSLTYDVYFGVGSSPPKVASNISVSTYDPGPLSYSTLYYWKIVAWDSHSASAAGPLWHFTTHINNPPNTPNNPDPENGATGISVNTNLSWSGGDPDGDSVTYDVYFGTTSSPPKVVSNQTDLLYDPGVLTYYTIYYWRIVAWDSHSASSAGPLWNFRTVKQPNRPPYAPSNPNPANGSIDVSLNPDLIWTGGDPDSGDIVTYDVYCGTTFPLTKIASNQTGTSHAIGPLQYNTKYYWKIVALDLQHASNASPVWSFTTITETGPPTVKITSPIRGFLYVNFWDIITRKIPIFIVTIIVGRIEVTATATDSQSGVDRVEFYIDDEYKANDTTAPYTWIWLEGWNFYPYKLKVIAYDNVGNQKSADMKVWKIF